MTDKDEIAAIKAENKRLKDELTAMAVMTKGSELNNLSLRAENERLRAALVKISIMSTDNYVDAAIYIAQTALKGGTE